MALPVDPRLARMVTEADRRGCLREVLVITAALSLQDPRERPAEQRARADQLHARFKDETSDFLTWLNLWRYVRSQQRELSSSAFRRMCRAEFLNYLRIREWQELEAQLRQVAKRLDLAVGKGRWEGDEPDADGIHQALLSGLLSHVGLRDPEKRDYLGARNTRFSVFPGSGLFRKQPQLLMSAELVETSRLYARVNAAIRPEWAEELGAHLVKRTYSEPHWSKRRAQVLAHERVTLYGVPLVADRLVSYGAVDREVARELFIRHALVYGEWSTRQRFMARNRELLGEVEELEHRARRRDILVDEHTLFDFYDARVGADVVSGAHFDTWWKQARREDPELLTFDPAMLVNETADAVTEQDYPDLWHEGALTLLAGLPVRAGCRRGRGHGRRTGGDAEPGRRGTVHLAGAGTASGPRRGADPVAAQAPAGQLRARPERRAGVPRRRVAGGGAAARRARAAPAGDDRRARPARGVGPREGPRAPAADVPGGRRGRRRRRRRQGPRGAEGAAAAAVRPTRWRRRPRRPVST